MHVARITSDMHFSQTQLQRLCAKCLRGQLDEHLASLRATAIATHRRELIRLGAELQRLNPANDSRYAA